MNKLSGVILIHNSERTIREAVVSIKNLIDELVLVNDSSTDRTLEIIQSLYPGARIIERKLDRFDHQRNFALEHVKNEWALMIDADEVITKELAASIKRELEHPRAEAYGCYRLNQVFNRYRKEKLPRPILFRARLRFEGALHETIKNRKYIYLDGNLIHNSWADFDEWLSSMNRYAGYRAKKWIAEGRNYGKFQLALIGIFMPPYNFLQTFFFQKRFLHGFFAGFLYCLAWSAEWVFVALKYYEMKYIQGMGRVDRIQ